MKIVFFDGYCNLCNGLVDFLMRADSRRRLHFASLQGETARQMLMPGLPRELSVDSDTIIFLRDGVRYERSTAILRILADLGGAWTAARVLLVLPPTLRDFFYRVIAKHRYRWFGRRESCRLPTAEEAARLLP
jgi:predicted DCC family thiol-disulfide oxidoreductase YuxK